MASTFFECGIDGLAIAPEGTADSPDGGYLFKLPQDRGFLFGGDALIDRVDSECLFAVLTLGPLCPGIGCSVLDHRFSLVTMGTGDDVSNHVLHRRLPEQVQQAKLHDRLI